MTQAEPRSFTIETSQLSAYVVQYANGQGGRFDLATWQPEDDDYVHAMSLELPQALDLTETALALRSLATMLERIAADQSSDTVHAEALEG